MISQHAKGVKYLLIGFLFVLVNINIPVYQYSSFDIMVNAIGYFVILKGLRLLGIKATILFALGRILLFISLLDIISFSPFSHSLTYYFSIFESVLQLVFIALLGKDLVELAKKYLYETETKAMFRWYLLVKIVTQFALTFVINLDEVLSKPFSFFLIFTFLILMDLMLLHYFYRLRKRILKVANLKMAEKNDDEFGFDEVEGAVENGG